MKKRCLLLLCLCGCIQATSVIAQNRSISPADSLFKPLRFSYHLGTTIYDWPYTIGVDIGYSVAPNVSIRLTGMGATAIQLDKDQHPSYRDFGIGISFEPFFKKDYFTIDAAVTGYRATNRGDRVCTKCEDGDPSGLFSVKTFDQLEARGIAIRASVSWFEFKPAKERQVGIRATFTVPVTVDSDFVPPPTVTISVIFDFRSKK